MRPAQERVLIPPPTPAPRTVPPVRLPQSESPAADRVGAPDRRRSNRAGRIAPVKSRFRIAPVESRRSNRAFKSRLLIAPAESRRLDRAD